MWGIIATHGDPATTRDNTLGGVDFNYRNSHINGDHVVETHTWVMTTESSGDSATGAEGGDIPGDDQGGGDDSTPVQAGGQRQESQFVDQTARGARRNRRE